MNMKQKVIEYLEDHPNATTEDLRKAFPSANKKSLWNYSGQWKKQKGLQKQEVKDSIRRKVFEFFDRNPGATLGDLRAAFPEANKVSISNYRYQWKKQNEGSSKKLSVKDQVYRVIRSRPGISFRELKKALPGINPSSVSAYHSQWKKGNTVEGDNRLTFLQQSNQNMSADSIVINSENEKELISALKATIEAQRDTIEAMKAQNALLKEKQSEIISELEGLSENQLDEVRRTMSTFINGMRKLT